MRTTLLMTAILGSTLAVSNAVGNAASIGGPGTTVYGSVPIGHLQPRGVPPPMTPPRASDRLGGEVGERLPCLGAHGTSYSFKSWHQDGYRR
jgi:hypothetical protein